MSQNRHFWVYLAGAALCAGLIWGGLRWPQALSEVSASFPFSPASEEHPRSINPIETMLKLVVAAATGIIVTTIHRQRPRDKPMTRSMEQAQVLLCVAGAMMMIIIGNSVARALGIAGGAGLIRFRTPIDDPKDAILLILLLGLGMASGLGAFAVVGFLTIFICLFLFVLDYIGDPLPKAVMLELVATGPDFPTDHVNDVLRRTVDFYESREVSQGAQTKVRYYVKLSPTMSMTYLNSELVRDGSAGIKSVSWETPKKSTS